MRSDMPSYRLHRPTNQAVVTLNGRDFYLGKYGSHESKKELDRLISEWLTGGRRLIGKSPSLDITIAELLVRYVEHAERYYRKGNGKQTSEVANIKAALRPLKLLYGQTAAREFGPLALKVVRQWFIEAGFCRKHVNNSVGRVVRAFRWASEHELVPATVHQALKTVAGLRRGRSDARESEPVRPIADIHVDAIRTFVAPQVWAMVELQRLTGMRPGEVCEMRTGDLDTTGRIWTYTPAGHKTEHYGCIRTIFLGPRAQTILRPWLRRTLSEFLFQPSEAELARVDHL